MQLTKAVRIWLAIVYCFIGAMVLVGGITRLTGSGLSMVEWRPLMGALPPLDEAAWQAVFAKYQLSPQFEVNHWMQLADFKRIFFWEYFHRLIGRLIGVVFFVPWLYFVVRRRLTGPWIRRTGIAFIFGGLQGLLGWFMVKSGLVDLPHVSHFRLTAHLSLAFALGAWVYWLMLRAGPTEPGPKVPAVHRALWGFLVLLSVQIVWGGFMAGSRAGYLYQSFPDINGHFAPTGLLSMNPVWDAPAIHFYHRLLAWLCLALGVFVVFWGRRRAVGTMQRRGLDLMGWALVFQFVLGAATVMTGVSLWIAAAHQLMAFILMSVTLRGVYLFSHRRGQVTVS